jgi:hypothetical protein
LSGKKFIHAPTPFTSDILQITMSRILLVEPDFPIPSKSRNHKNFLPIGLLKIATYLRDHSHKVMLIRGIPKDLYQLKEINNFHPDEVWVTSLFTYWASHVRDAVQYYRRIFSSSNIKVGGIYASLISTEEVKAYTGCDDVHQGVIPEVENYIRSHPPAYELLGKLNPHPIDFQIIHASRGCLRRCSFCGTWEIEPEFNPKMSIKGELRLPGVVFYDNNFLMNPYVENILDELIELIKDRKVRWVESQSGIDGRVLLDKPHLANKLKDAGFRYPRIAWDWGYDQSRFIKSQIDILVKAGFESRDIFIFMLYNHSISFDEMEEKRIKCWEWQTQIADCRYRPLNQLVDEYKPYIKGQTSKDYYISDRWDDILVKQFRCNVRRQNICVRMRYPIYSVSAERKCMEKEDLKKLRGLKTLEEKKAYLETSGADWWIPERKTYPELDVHK